MKTAKRTRAFVALLALLAVAPLSQAQRIRPSGSVVAWGWQFVNGYVTAVPVAAQSGVVAIAAGGIAGSGHTVALKSDGSVMQWGYNPSAVPSDLPPALAIAAGGYVTVALVREPEPSLSLLRLEDQTLSLSWNGAGVLEQAKRLTSPDWQPASNQDNPHTIKTTDPMMFFRVKTE